MTLRKGNRLEKRMKEEGGGESKITRKTKKETKVDFNFILQNTQGEPRKVLGLSREARTKGPLGGKEEKNFFAEKEFKSQWVQKNWAQTVRKQHPTKTTLAPTTSRTPKIGRVQ